MRGHRTQRFLSVVLSLSMALSSFPTSSLAKSVTQPETTVAGQASEASEVSRATDAQEVPSQAFRQEATIDGVRVTVEADEGAFPADATLCVTSVTDEQKAQAERAVDESRPEGRDVAHSYAFDIKVLAADGSDLQPANEREARVSFALEQAADEHFDAQVYHLVETSVADVPADGVSTDQASENRVLEAQPLEITMDEDGQHVSVATNGFSIYVVQLTYGSLSYQIPFNAAVPLSTILEAVGLSDKGTVTAASISQKENQPLLFQVSQTNGTWFVLSQQTAPSEADNARGTLLVNCGGFEYRIGLTMAKTGAVTVHKEWVGNDGYPLEAPDDQGAVTIRYTVTNPADEVADGGEAAPGSGGDGVGEGGAAPTSGYASSGTLTLDSANGWSQQIIVPEPFSGTIALSEEPVAGFKATEWTLNSDNPYALPFDGTTATLDASRLYDERGAFDTANVNKLIDDGTARITVANASTSRGVDYVSRWWDGSAVRQQTLRIFDAGGTLHAVADLARSGWDGTLQDGHWYYVEDTVSFDRRLTVRGTSHLILCDGARLTLGQGVNVPDGATLNVYGQERDSGELKANGGNLQAAIGGNQNNHAGSIVIQGGTVTAQGGSEAAGIGGGLSRGGTKSISILGGTVTATGGANGAGIGGGTGNTNQGAITIYGGTVEARAGLSGSGAGIGGGSRANAGDVVIEGGSVKAYGGNDGEAAAGGSGIGSGAWGQSAKVTINGGTVEAYGSFSAGIGGGAHVQGGEVTINGGSIKAQGGTLGAGIGGGRLAASTKVTINGGAIEAHGGRNAAGIGSGGDVTTPKSAGEIAISGGKVTAFGGEGGAGIGGGTDCDGATFAMVGGELNANGGRNAAGIGGGGDGPDSGTNGGMGGTTSIRGGKVVARGGADAAGIGSGEGSMWDGRAMGGITTIAGGTVYAEGGEGGAGIGGGYRANGNQVAISGGATQAVGGTGAAGIGGGTSGSGGAVVISGGIVEAAAVRGGAGIGGGGGHGGADVTVTGGIVVANGGSKQNRAIGKGSQAIISFRSDGRLTLGDDIGVTYGSRYSIAEGVATRETRVERCRDHSFVRLQGLANSFEVRVRWTDGTAAAHPSSVKVRYRLRRVDGTVARSGTLELTREGNAYATGRVYVEPGFDGTLEVEEDPIGGYRIRTWDFGEVAPAGGGVTTSRDTRNNDGTAPFPVYGPNLGTRLDVAGAIKGGTGVVTVTNEPYLPLAVRKAWPGGSETLPDQVIVRYELTQSGAGAGTPRVGTLALRAGDATERSWRGVVNLADEGGARYDSVTLVEDPVPAGYTPQSWRLDLGSTDAGLGHELQYPTEGTRERATLDLSSTSRLTADQRLKAWEAIAAGQATVTLANAPTTETRTLTAEKRWVLGSHGDERPQSTRVVLQRKVTGSVGDASETASWEQVGEPLELNAQNGWKASFKPVPRYASDAAGSSADATSVEYRIRELDKDGRVVGKAGDEGASSPDYSGSPAADGYRAIATLAVTSGSGDGTESRDAHFFVGYSPAGSEGDQDGSSQSDSDTTVITNTLGRQFLVEKAWDVDQAGKDRPATVKVQLQRRDDAKAEQDDDHKRWDEVETVELSGEGTTWKGSFAVVELFKPRADGASADQPLDEYAYRVRELTEGDSPKTVYDRTDKDEPETKGLLSKLTDWDAIWQVDFTAEAWESYLKDKGARPKVPTVVYTVSNASAGEPSGTGSQQQGSSHKTKYLVTYATDGDTTKITNTAVMDVSIYKRWLMFGQAKKPDSVYLMLMGRVKQSREGAAGAAAGASDAKKIPYVPVYNALYGDAMGASGIAEVMGLREKLNGVGVTDEKIDGNVRLGLAIAKAKDNPDNALTAWRVRFGVRKYDAMTKMEMEYLGAEQVTGLIKIGTDTLTGFEFPAMLQPIPQRYLSVFGKAYNIFADYELTSNVINTWLSLDGDIADGVGGTKLWRDNDNADGLRPSSVTLHVYYQDGDAKREATGSPVTVSAESNWTWSLGFKSGAPEIGKTFTIEEEAVPGYTTSYDGYDVINTRDGSTPTTTSVSGHKTWNDNGNVCGKRPASITIRLLADGVEKDSKTVTASDGWAWSWKDLPRYRADGTTPIAYGIAEDPVPGYRSAVSGYDVANTLGIPRVDPDPETPDPSYTPPTTDGTTSVGVSKRWEGAGDQGGVRPASVTVRLLANGIATSKTATLTGPGWSATFSDLPETMEGEKIAYSVTEELAPGYQYEITGNAAEGFTITNTLETRNVAVSKTWDDENDQDGIRPESVRVRLAAKAGDRAVSGLDGRELTLRAESGWRGAFEGLPVRAGGEAITYGVEEVPDEVVSGTDGARTYACSVTGDAEGGFTVTNRHTPQTTTVEVRKTWEDAGNADKRPSSITLRLRANGLVTQTATVRPDASGSWDHTFRDLPKYQNGREVAYTVTEDAVPGYTQRQGQSGGTGAGNVIALTNAYAADKTSVTISKAWADEGDHDKIRPRSVKVALLADGRETGQTATLSLANGWTHTFSDLDRQRDGREIAYSVRESGVPDGYASEVTGDASRGFTITNTHAPEKTRTVTVTKVWDDANNQDGVRPDHLDLRLSYDGREVKSQRVTVDASKGEQSWEIEGVPVVEGEDVSAYSLAEDAVVGYSTRVTGNVVGGYTIYNRHAPDTQEIRVRKVWDDADNQDGARPSSVTVRLVADGEATDKTAVLSAEHGWSATFSAAKRRAGKSISYGVSEDAVAGYETTCSGTTEEGFTVTNTHRPETTEVKGRKTWAGDEGDGETRPSSVTVRLRADGTVRDTKTVTASDGWAWSWQGLPKYDDGREIFYSVTEDRVDDYAADYDGANVRNTLQRGKTQVDVVRMWNDAQNQDGIRPDYVKIILKANGRAVAGPKGFVVLSGYDNDVYSFTGLARRDASGKDIVYTVEEERTGVLAGTDGPGTYAVEVAGDASQGFTVVNTHTPETTEVSGRKTWEDEDDAGRTRPDSITVRLRANGDLVDARRVSAADGWAWSWKDLPAYKNGARILYTTTEEAVDGYAHSYNDHNVTNRLAGDTVQVDVVRAWDDFGNADGSRPGSVRLILLANGRPVQLEQGDERYGTDNQYYGIDVYEDGRFETTSDEVLAEGGGGVYSFCDLPRTDRYGQEIDYDVEEAFDDVITGEDGPGTYAVTILGNADEGITVVNTHTPQLVSVEGTKSWDDAGDAGRHPDAITIRLRANGREVASSTVEPNASGVWKWHFADLPQYDAGKEISYTVTEDATFDYVPSYSSADADDPTVRVRNVTNAYEPGLTSVSVAKVWNDGGNRTGPRPQKVDVRLLADGEPTSLSLELSEENGWVDTFFGLQAYDGDREIAYTVEEEPVEGYVASVAGNAVEGYTITNTPEGAGQSGYQVQYFYERDGAYAKTPDAVDDRMAPVGAKVRVTEADKVPDPARGRYVLDDSRAQAFVGAVDEDGTLVLRVYFRQVFLITYDLNGGTFAGSGDDVVERHFFGDAITILEAPLKAGSTFAYWKGSEYHPGDPYTVRSDHTFVAQWSGEDTPPGTPGTPAGTLPKTGDTGSGTWPEALALIAAAALAVGAWRRRGSRRSRLASRQR